MRLEVVLLILVQFCTVSFLRHYIILCISDKKRIGAGEQIFKSHISYMYQAKSESVLLYVYLCFLFGNPNSFLTADECLTR